MRDMNEIIAYLRARDALRMTPQDALRLIADHPRAQDIILSPNAIRDALMRIEPERGDALFALLGIRQPYSLAALCHLAQYDDWLMYAMSLLIEALVAP